jgi:hypothetical protein
VNKGMKRKGRGVVSPALVCARYCPRITSLSTKLMVTGTRAIRLRRKKTEYVSP